MWPNCWQNCKQKEPSQHKNWHLWLVAACLAVLYQLLSTPACNLQHQLIQIQKSFLSQGKIKSGFPEWSALVDAPSEAMYGREIVQPPPNLIIQSDASLQGWGAACNEMRSGHWSDQEGTLHINSLELLEYIIFWSQGFYQAQEQDPNSTADGQQHCGGLCEQNWVY